MRTWRLVTHARGGDTFLSGITEFAAGAALPMHYHNCQESVVILEGSAGFDSDGEVQHLEPNAATLIMANVPHRFTNLSSHRLRILWIYGSVDANRTLVATAETRRIADEG